MNYFVLIPFDCATLSKLPVKPGDKNTIRQFIVLVLFPNHLTYDPINLIKIH